MSIEKLSWRERLKSGRLSGFYRVMRNAKRTIRGEPISGTPPMLQSPLSAPELRALATRLPDHARLCFSLALAYLDPDCQRSLDRALPPDAVAHRRALACLRSAETLGFEASERVAVHKGWIYARLGRTDHSCTLVESLQPWELDEEATLLEMIRSGSIQSISLEEAPSAARWAAAKTEVDQSGTKALAAFGDTDAVTADWLPSARYISVDEAVTGLTVDAASRLSIDYEVCVGTAESRLIANQCRINWRRWVLVAAN